MKNNNDNDNNNEDINKEDINKEELIVLYTKDGEEYLVNQSMYNSIKKATKEIKINTNINNKNDTLFRALCNIEGNKQELYNLIQFILGYRVIQECDNIIEFSLSSQFEHLIDIKNDISFIRDDEKTVILFEAQTIYSKKMPVRVLLYYARLMELYLRRKGGIHNIKDVDFKIPRPEFYVIYFKNNFPDEDYIRDNFIDNIKSEFLECKVKNIMIDYDVIKNYANNKICKNNLDLEVYTLFIENYAKIKDEVASSKNILEDLQCKELNSIGEKSKVLLTEIFYRTLEVIREELGEDVINSELYRILSESSLNKEIKTEVESMVQVKVLLKEIEEKDNALEERDKELAERDNELAERDNELAERDNELAERDNELEERDKELAERDNELAERDKALAERDNKIKQMEIQIQKFMKN
ncbi:MAG: hypothetical protein R3Y29_01885 [bacterium]